MSKSPGFMMARDMVLPDPILPVHENSLPTRCFNHSKGYSELAFLISTDQDFSIFRRFDELSARNLLRMQAELVQIDDELHIRDSYVGELSAGEAERRDATMMRLNILMARYHKALLLQHQIHQLNSPTQSMANRFDLWIRNASEKKPVNQEDYEPSAPPVKVAAPSYWRVHDYVLLKSTTFKDTWLERWTRRCLGRFLQDERPVPVEWSGYYFERSKVERIKDYLAFPVAVMFLVAPALLFHYICDGNKRLAILLGFIVGLALSVQIFMGTGRKETLATALAYTGVMGLLLNVGTAERCKNL